MNMSFIFNNVTSFALNLRLTPVLSMHNARYYLSLSHEIFFL